MPTSIKSDTPVAMMTIGQLASYLGLNGAREQKETSNTGSSKSYVYGLRGIQNLFNVSHTTAQMYKDGILREAVYQSGRKIVVDVEKAIDLFNSSREARQ